MEGIVYIIGAGSGDERLITLKALECIKKSDVIVYDRLINTKLLSYAKESAEKIDAGKKAGNHTIPQHNINEILASKAKEGKYVVRLKGGDPFVFGRGGEEAIHLFQGGIKFEIVPGISAVNAVTAYAGIPVTHRNVSSSFHVITGHENPSKEEEAIDYKVIAKLSGTLVFFMGLNNLDTICENLINYGKKKETPVAVISNGTRVNQKTVCGTLENIGTFKAEMESPALIVVGEVVSLRKYLNWFEGKTSSKKRVLVTRSKEQSQKICSRLKDIDTVPVELPMIEVKDNIDRNKEIYLDIEKYDWIVFTSENAVKIFIKGLMKYKEDIRSISKAKIAVIGSATEKALNNYYLKSEISPKEFESEKLAEELKHRVKRGEKVLIPTSNIAHNSIAQTLEEIGAELEVVYIYDVVSPQYESGKLSEILEKVNVLTFTSPSCVKGFMKNFQGSKLDFKLLEHKEIICIGHITAEALEKVNIKNYKCARTHNVEGIVELLR
ncbi:uroporphyrinogen-III C-methyltransferase [Clostridium pasteurianum]|uniref:uroporphyrinogen-III C-methyltransferase n=1 Tax=Clostridium pasteurianum BC1 TaxID=86416 RepID=R4KEU3_CLOPA|nr:uroporphyrinogen-III C-methyltransferase [Clostridium pasteurianum]AGK99054.1 uroporphyrin-III C-methyltransferase [Clostridium pasteurianum BC1]